MDLLVCGQVAKVGAALIYCAPFALVKKLNS